MNYNRILTPWPFVVLLKLLAQAARLNAHDGLDFGIVAGSPAEDLDADYGLFEPFGFAVHRAIHHEAQELSHALGVDKPGTCQNLCEVTPNQSCLIGHAGQPGLPIWI